MYMYMHVHVYVLTAYMYIYIPSSRVFAVASDFSFSSFLKSKSAWRKYAYQQKYDAHVPCTYNVLIAHVHVCMYTCMYMYM